MDKEIALYLEKISSEIQALYSELRSIIYEYSCESIEERAAALGV